MRQRFAVALGALLAATAGQGFSADQHEKAVFLGAFVWNAQGELFGGFSGLDLSGNGEFFVVTSDRGAIVEGRFVRSEDRIVGIVSQEPQILRDPEGQRMPKPMSDSEGLAIGPNGERYISFEGLHRVWRYDPEGGPEELPAHPDFASLQSNSSLEALAIDDGGALYTLPERSGALDLPFPVYRFADGVWDQPFSISRTAGFLPVGADFGPDGRFYLLERGFTGFGFRAQVRRFDLIGGGLRNELTVLQTPVLRHDNLEGLSVWRDAKSRIRLTMVSDDNFRSFQKTEFVEYVLTE